MIRNAHDSGAELIATLSQPYAATQSATKALELAWPPPHKRLKVAIRSKRSVVNQRRAQAQLACSGGDAGSACRGKVSLTFRKRIVRRIHGHRRVIHRRIVVASARYTVTSGQTQTVELPLTNAAVRLLERDSDHRLRVRATATLRGGSAARRALVVRLPLIT